MILLKYILIGLSFALFGTAVGLVGYDVWIAFQLRRLLQRGVAEDDTAPLPFTGPAARRSASDSGRPIRWSLAGRLACIALAPLLLSGSMSVVPDGYAGVRVSEISGVQPGTLYPGLHLVTPLVEHIATYDLRDHIYATSAYAGKVGETAAAAGTGQRKVEVLTVQAREGLSMGIGVAVRYRLDAQRLGFIHQNVPQPVEPEVIAPIVSSIFRAVAAEYVVRDVFTIHRTEFESRAAKEITERLAADGIVVKEVTLRDVQLPVEYAKGLESLLLKEQESERMVFETEIKQKEVKIADLEAEGQKARDIRQAEGAAQVRVLQAKAEADAMQYTLPLKQKQIEQSRLEAEARKEATIQNAQAAADSKVIDSKAELERRKFLADADAQTKLTDGKAEAEKRRMLAEADANTIRVTAAADSERLNLEAAALRSNPMLIQKMIAERLSDKLQIIMVPMDGKNFFAGDVLKSAFSGIGPSTDSDGDSPKVVAKGNPTKH
jgi:regulator of protease activity HflC (stomatin/prohibitin superfamily)